MGLPVENYKGYVEADATQKAKNMESDKFFLIHGMADATAPYHHSVQMAKALTKAGTIYRYTVRSAHLVALSTTLIRLLLARLFQSYADEGHDLRGVTEHVHRSMEHYFRNCLNLDEDSEVPVENAVPSE
jgi:inactive dipeptidyl peptidase 10